MKRRILTLALLGCLATMTATAQENVKNAFNEFIASKKVIVTKTISEERDFTKANRPLIAKADVYSFTLKKKDRKFIDEVLAAFEKDRSNEYVYTVLTHNGGHGVPTNARELLVGKDRKKSVYIGMNDVESWQLLCLLDPADSSRTHRYAYAIEWNDDAKQVQLTGKIRGKLVITYCVIPSDLLDAYGGKKKDDDVSTSRIAQEVYKMGLAGKYDRFENETQILLAFNALKTEFLKGNTFNTSEGGTIAMTIYSLCSYLAPIIKDKPDLREHLRQEIGTMINVCDANTDLGKSHIGYLKLAIKALQ
ncbi:MAG: hypothetical protein IKX24_09710 [Prevotella sp.]|nr:hypothetical protein [Prevotella sp.]